MDDSTAIYILLFIALMVCAICLFPIPAIPQ